MNCIADAFLFRGKCNFHAGQYILKKTITILVWDKIASLSAWALPYIWTEECGSVGYNIVSREHYYKQVFYFDPTVCTRSENGAKNWRYCCFHLFDYQVKTTASCSPPWAGGHHLCHCAHLRIFRTPPQCSRLNDPIKKKWVNA